MADVFDDRLKRLEETGEWWIDPWWRDSQMEFPFPRETATSIIEVLRRHFGAEWARDIANKPRPNIVFPHLCIGGTLMASRFLSSLGEMFLTLEASAGFRQKTEDLRGDKGESAYLELEAARAFARAGYAITFPPEGKNKTPDILVERNGLQIAVECKRLRDEIWESWEEQLTSELLHALPDTKDGKPLTIHVALSPRLTEIRLNEKESSLNEAFLQTILGEIDIALKRSIAEHTPSFTMQLSELATVEVLFRTPNQYSSVTGVERTSPAIFRRVFQNGVLRALEQLPTNIPSAVVVYSKYEPSPQFFRLFFDAACKTQPERFSSLTAVVLCTVSTVFRSSAPYIFPNKYSTFQRCANDAQDVFQTFSGAIVA